MSRNLHGWQNSFQFAAWGNPLRVDVSRFKSVARNGQRKLDSKINDFHTVATSLELSARLDQRCANLTNPHEVLWLPNTIHEYVNTTRVLLE